MVQRRFGFGSYDVGPGKMLVGTKEEVEKGRTGKGSLAEYAREQGHDIVAVTPQTRGECLRRIDALRTANAVLLGLSSRLTEEELEAADILTDLGTPVVIVADTFGAALRPKAKVFAPKVAMTVVAHPSDIEPARDFGYRNPVYAGPPPHWGVDYAAMGDAEQLRSTLMKEKDGLTVPFKADDRLIYVEGGKGRPEMLTGMMKSVLHAAQDLLDDHLVFHFGRHPGERAEQPEEEERYRSAFAEREAILQEVHPWTLANTLTAPQRVALADLSVFSGGPTQSIIGAYHRKPMAYFSQNAAQYMGEQVSGASSWVIADLGAMHIVDDPADTAVILRRALSEEGRYALQKQQEIAFPLPNQWDSRARIFALIEDMLDRED